MVVERGCFVLSSNLYACSEGVALHFERALIESRNLDESAGKQREQEGGLLSIPQR